MLHNITSSYQYYSPKWPTYRTLADIASFTVDPDVDVNARTSDYGSMLSSLGINHQETFYVMNQTDTNVSVDAYALRDTGEDPEVVMFPRYHQYTEYEHFPKTNALLRDIHIVGGHYEIDSDSQPVLYVYSPYIQTILEVTTVATDVVKREYERDITFMDVMPGLIDFGTTFEGRLMNSVYQYDGYRVPDIITQLSHELDTTSIPDMLQYISEHFGTSCEPIRYQNTMYAYTPEMLWAYIVQNTISDPIYYPNINGENPMITKIRNRDDVVVQNDVRTYVGVGTQPTGAYLQFPLTIFQPNMKSEDIALTSQPVFFFRIDETIEDLNTFRMIDEESGIDISPYTILLYKHKLYAFNENYESWIHCESQ